MYEHDFSGLLGGEKQMICLSFRGQQIKGEM